MNPSFSGGQDSAPSSSVHRSKLKAERHEYRRYDVEGLLQFKAITKFIMGNICSVPCRYSAHTRMGCPICIWAAHTRTAYGLPIRVWAAHTRTGNPYARMGQNSCFAHMRMSAHMRIRYVGPYKYSYSYDVARGSGYNNFLMVE